MKRRTALITFLVCATARPALAGPFYVETGVGMGSLMAGANYMSQAGLPAMTAFQFAGSFALFYSFSEPSAGFQFHLGAKSNMITLVNGTNHGMFLMVQPVVRFDLQRLYFGAGFAPLGMRAYSPTPMNFAGLQSVTGAWGLYGEFGLLWRPVDFFNIALEGNAYFVTLTGGLSPAPALSILIQMRFYFPYEEGAGSASGQKRLDGWRYPFGIRL